MRQTHLQPLDVRKLIQECGEWLNTTCLRREIVVQKFTAHRANDGGAFERAVHAVDRTAENASVGVEKENVSTGSKLNPQIVPLCEPNILWTADQPDVRKSFLQ